MQLKDQMGAIHVFIQEEAGFPAPHRVMSIRKLYDPQGGTRRRDRRIQVALADGFVFNVHENWAINLSEHLFKMFGPHADVVDQEPGTEC